MLIATVDSYTESGLFVEISSLLNRRDLSCLYGEGRVSFSNLKLARMQV